MSRDKIWDMAKVGWPMSARGFVLVLPQKLSSAPAKNFHDRGHLRGRTLAALGNLPPINCSLLKVGAARRKLSSGRYRTHFWSHSGPNDDRGQITDAEAARMNLPGATPRPDRPLGRMIKRPVSPPERPPGGR